MHCLNVDSGVAPSEVFWSPEHMAQFSEMVKGKTLSATFQTAHTELGKTVYDVELKDVSGSSINQKFGSMTLSAGGRQSVSRPSAFIFSI